MEPFPHHYRVYGTAHASSPVTLKVEDLPEIVSAAPREFGGPGDKWSPEGLLIAAVADCFILSFKAIAQASRFEWTELHCEVDGTLDRIDRTTRFTAISVSAELRIAADADSAKAEKLLQKAEHSCLITNSLIADTHLETRIIIDS